MAVSAVFTSELKIFVADWNSFLKDLYPWRFSLIKEDGLDG
jgi:hypothetical protein